ncbi:MAG: gamma-glutamyl-gamma-aminobutyrate hydrolase family protein [Roseiflexus sp.]
MTQQKRPTIGVVGAFFGRKGSAPISGIGRTYLEAIEAGGGIPLLIHLTGDQDVLDAHYRCCNGLMFCGGEDIDPKHYGHPRHPRLGPVDEMRDEIELALARRAVADRKPVLAICRGIQLINVALGGTLYQDIQDELPGTLDHRASSKGGDRAYLAHTLELDSASWLAEHLGTTTIEVNTLHHQALRDVAPGLRVVGYAPDRIIEAVESTGDAFIVGVQCHPEELWQSAEKRWARLFTDFVAHVAA